MLGYARPSSFSPYPTPHTSSIHQTNHQVGFVLQSGVKWETALSLIRSELRNFQKEGIDPLSESVARELLVLAASKVCFG